MNAPISRGSAALLFIGAVAILLLGAFSRIDPTAPLSAPSANTTADASIQSAGGPELPADLSPGLADLIRLAQGHVDETVILAFIQNSGQTYSPKADEILYLSDLGLSQTVLAALFKQKPPAQPETATGAVSTPVLPLAPPAPPGPSEPSATPTAAATPFYHDLAPYGAWTQIPNYGLCWQPAVETLNPDWRPYVDQGQWLYTDNGWYWQSGYSWGGIAFHYGRWARHNRFGWLWVPDQVWGPAWVSWRIAFSYSGWAPLPPGVGLATAGLTFHNRRAAAGFDFGLPAGWFTFVSEASFRSRNPADYAVPAGQAGSIYARSVPVNNYSIANQKIFNLGPGRPAAAEAGPAQPSMGLIPARKIESAAGSQPVPGNDPQPLLAWAAGEEAVGAPPRFGLDPPGPAPAQPPKPHRRHGAETHATRSNLTAAPRWEPPVNHDFFRHYPNAGPFLPPPQPDPARLMAASGPPLPKSGK
jgi:hypothetical protein